MTHRACLAVLLVAASITGPAFALEKIYLFRHAEKAEHWSEEPALEKFQPLSAAGRLRAEALAEALEDKGIGAIYASHTTRALATGMALSERTGVPVTAEPSTVDPAKMEGFLDELPPRHRQHGAVLIVGHSNTIPALLVRLGARPECYEKLGISETPRGLRIEGYTGLWEVELGKDECSGVARRVIELPDSP